MAEWTRHRSTALRRRIEKALGPTGDAGDIVDAHTARDMLDEIDRLGALIKTRTPTTSLSRSASKRPTSANDGPKTTTA